MATAIGPEREVCALAQEEAEVFRVVVEFNTKSPERFQLSYASSVVTHQQSLFVQDGFQRCARFMWRTAPTGISPV
jgi:hypothetical protein